MVTILSLTVSGRQLHQKSKIIILYLSSGRNRISHTADCADYKETYAGRPGFNHAHKIPVGRDHRQNEKRDVGRQKHCVGAR